MENVKLQAVQKTLSMLLVTKTVKEFPLFNQLVTVDQFPSELMHQNGHLILVVFSPIVNLQSTTESY